MMWEQYGGIQKGGRGSGKVWQCGVERKRKRCGGYEESPYSKMGQ